MLSDVLCCKYSISLLTKLLTERHRGTRFHAQKSRNDFISAFCAFIPWNLFGIHTNPFARWNPFRPLFQMYYVGVMNRYINCCLEDRLGDVSRTNDRKYKTVMDLALDKSFKEEPGPNETRLSADFKRSATNQMKVFILAEHDTTSATLCFVFHLLSRHPSALQRVRMEHNQVFGFDLTKTSTMIIENPHFLNQLTFTFAVIKETLRLFTLSSTARQGESGFFLTHDGLQYPTEGFNVWGSPHAMHREPLFWPQPDSFIPERWLVSDDDPLHAMKEAWRPFGWGSRVCLGQELALLEIKVVLVMTLRDFNIVSSYETWDRMRGNKNPNTVNGERAYHVLKGTARPADGFPCRVTMVE